MLFEINEFLVFRNVGEHFRVSYISFEVCLSYYSFWCIFIVFSTCALHSSFMIVRSFWLQKPFTIDTTYKLSSINGNSEFNQWFQLQNNSPYLHSVWRSMLSVCVLETLQVLHHSRVHFLICLYLLATFIECALKALSLHIHVDRYFARLILR